MVRAAKREPVEPHGGAAAAAGGFESGFGDGKRRRRAEAQSEGEEEGHTPGVLQRRVLRSRNLQVKNRISARIDQRLLEFRAMISTAIDTFYLTDEQLEDSPSRKDGIDKATETTLRIYGCDLIQESGILLKLPQAVMATGQVLFHRFYCKKSFTSFNVKMVAASCTWLASKLEESRREARLVLIVFHRMECRREKLPLEHLDIASKKYKDMEDDLIKTERRLLIELGFICHVEHPHKFIPNYLATLETPAEVTQEAWNLANDSLRTTLCVRFKSEVVACGVIYAATRRFQIPLPEDPPWWLAFDADKSGIEEVCRVLAHLYSLPKAQYISVCKEGGSFSKSSNNNKSWDSAHPVGKEGPLNGSTMNADTLTTAANEELGKDALLRVALDKFKDSKKSDPESRGVPVEEEGRAESAPQVQAENRTEAGGERNIERGRERDRDRDRDREREKDKGGKTSRGHDRGSKSDRERYREDTEGERQRLKDQGHRSRDKGKDGEKAKHHSSRDRGYHSSSYSSREKERSRHH